MTRRRMEGWRALASSGRAREGFLSIWRPSVWIQRACSVRTLEIVSDAREARPALKTRRHQRADPGTKEKNRRTRESLPSASLGSSFRQLRPAPAHPNRYPASVRQEWNR